jgi:hypothetical protein
LTRRNVKETRPNGISRYWIRSRNETVRQNVRHCIAIKVSMGNTLNVRKKHSEVERKEKRKNVGQGGVKRTDMRQTE